MALKIKQRKISELIRAEYNPRELTQDEYNQLKDSLLRFGVVDPVLVNINKDRKNIIIGGHQRCKVWEDLEQDTIPCIELDLSLEKEKELNIRLNKNTGHFSFELLEEHFNTDDLIDWGFEEYEFDQIDQVDYTLLDDDDENVDNQLRGMSDNVKKSIQIEFDNYDEAFELIKFWREQDANIGAMITEKLKAEKDNL